jgi:alkylated DNA repair dioxygenase AlkB
MPDLFDAEVGLERIVLPDGDMRFQKGFLGTRAAEQLFDELYRDVPWRDEQITVWGKRHLQPRRVAWFGDSDARYAYSGLQMQVNPWTPTLLGLKGLVEEACGESFNSVLLNLYRNQNDRMGWHSDNEPELGAKPTIASVSLGASRMFQMKHKIRKDVGLKSFELTSGSLLVMAGATQKYWLHSIRKESKHVDSRINLTFRKIISA